MIARRRMASASLIALVIAAALAAPGVARPPATPTPRVVGVPVVSRPPLAGVKGHAFGAAPTGLLPRFGYVEEELFVSGMAAGYDLSPTALVPLGIDTPLSPLPYRTRIIVRRPARAEAFNGTVLLEWLNVTSGYDVDSEWAHLHPEILRSGYAYVGVSAQLVGTIGLKLYDPLRYATVVHAGDSYSFDIFAQVAKAMRSARGVAPMGDHPVRHVLATGSSQSASALDTFLERVRPDIERVIDGYLIAVGGDAVPADLDVPVLRVLSEGEANGEGAPDSPRYRQWETAGGSHADSHHGAYWAQTHDRDWGTPPGTWPLTPRDTPFCRIGSFPRMYAGRAALNALTRWVGGGAPPPVADRITVRDGAIARDGFGNALGGIRLPAIEVPTATYDGEAFGCGPTLGETKPFSAAMLDRLYPTHAGYVHAVAAAADVAVAQGFLLPPDAAEIVAFADASDVGADQ
jgi:hypothetical protein